MEKMTKVKNWVSNHKTQVVWATVGTAVTVAFIVWLKRLPHANYLPTPG